MTVTHRIAPVRTIMTDEAIVNKVAEIIGEIFWWRPTEGPACKKAAIEVLQYLSRLDDELNKRKEKGN